MAVYNDATVIGGCPVEEGSGDYKHTRKHRSTPHKKE
jgi:hypothetical protein